MTKMMKIACLATLLIAIGLMLACTQDPTKNPLVAKKFKEVQELAERVQTLEDRFNMLNRDIETILDDITTIKQDFAKGAPESADFSAIEERLNKIESELKTVKTLRVARPAPETSPKPKESATAPKTAESKSAETKEAPKTSQREKEYVTPKGFYHDVKEGDTLETIAKQYGLTAAAIAKENRFPSGAKLHAGQKIFIPKTK